MESEQIKNFITEHFKGYEFPFEDANRAIEKLPGHERIEYYEEAGKIARSKVWKTELENLLRHYFSHLAFKASSEKNWSEVDCYRLTVLMIQDFDKRLQTLASLAGSPLGKIAAE